MSPEQRAERVLASHVPFPPEHPTRRLLVREVARAIRAAENAVLERAAKIAATPNGSTRYETASAIRALKSRAPKRNALTKRNRI